MPFVVREVDGGASFGVRVQPGAKREGALEIYGEALKVAIAAPAVDGKANEALTAVLATMLGVPRRSVAIVSGEHSRSKVVRVLGTTAEAVQAVVLGIGSV